MRISDWSSDVCSSDLQTGLTGCGNDGRSANVLANGPNATVTPGWYADFDNSILGYEGDEDDPAITTGAGVADRVDGTDSVELIGLEGTGLSVANSPWNAANFKINETSNDRSEEHTSELQSLMRISYAVLCLTKKIKNNNQRYVYYIIFNRSLTKI